MIRKPPITKRILREFALAAKAVRNLPAWMLELEKSKDGDKENEKQTRRQSSPRTIRRASESSVRSKII